MWFFIQCNILVSLVQHWRVVLLTQHRQLALQLYSIAIIHHTEQSGGEHCYLGIIAQSISSAFLMAIVRGVTA